MVCSETLRNLDPLIVKVREHSTKIGAQGVKLAIDKHGRRSPFDVLAIAAGCWRKSRSSNGRERIGRRRHLCSIYHTWNPILAIDTNRPILQPVDNVR
jgi:hypothetical protein